jgi:hypothetical protein
MRHKLAVGFGLFFLASAITAQHATNHAIVSKALSGDLEDWDAEKFKSARPIEIPLVSSLRRLEPSTSNGDTEGLPLRVGRAGAKPLTRSLLTPGKTLFNSVTHQSDGSSSVRQNPQSGSTSVESQFSTRNRGKSLLDFSSSRLIPSDVRIFYPYRAIGKLFITLNNGRTGTCTAAVFSTRLVLTAGHCVHDGTSGFYRAFRFIPAYQVGDDPNGIGQAPFGEWRSSHVFTTTEWAEGGGEVPNAADFGVLVIADQDGQKIGNVTGWLG